MRFRVLTHYREKIVCQNFPQFIGEYGQVGEILFHFCFQKWNAKNPLFIGE